MLIQKLLPKAFGYPKISHYLCTAKRNKDTIKRYYYEKSLGRTTCDMPFCLRQGKKSLSWGEEPWTSPLFYFYSPFCTYRSTKITNSPHTVGLICRIPFMPVPTFISTYMIIPSMIPSLML